MDTPFPAYEGDEPYIFVCYAHEDADVVYPELQRLRDGSVNIWYDEGISAGQEWTQSLADAIEGSTQFLNFVSPSSVASRHCRNEVQYALEQDKALISVYLEPTELPGGLKLSLGLAQAIMKYEISEADYQRKMADSLRVSALPREGAPKPGADEAATTLTLAIAVLPFVNMSNDPEQEFFSDGIAEDLLNELARSADLIVRPRSSSFRFKASNEDSQSVGRRLDVSHVVEGSVRTSGERVRVSTHLIEVAGNRSIWSQRYEREMVDIFKVQDEITGEILAALNAHLGSRGSPRSFAGNDAYNAFLRGRYEFSQFKLAEANRWLATAVALDPENADAWALRAGVSAYQSEVELKPNGGEHLERRREYISKALSMDPENAGALGTRALMDAHYVNRDDQGAVNEFVRLIKLHPNREHLLASLSWVLTAVHRADLVHRISVQALKLAPLSRNAWGARLSGLLTFGPVEEARQAMGEYSSLGYSFPIFSAQMALADSDTAALEAVIPQDSWGSGAYVFFAALVPYLKGDFQRAREIIAPLKRAHGYQPFRLKAFIALVEQDIDAALADYRRAIRAAEPASMQNVHGTLGYRRAFPEFYADPRYGQMLEEFKLDPVSTAKVHVPDLPF